jgi:hypothetical protein
MMEIMMELHVVKGPVEVRLVLENDDDDDLGNGCKVMLHLLWFWTSAKCHIICAGSYFPSSLLSLCFELPAYWCGENSNKVVSEDIFGKCGVAPLWDCGSIDGLS